MGITYSTYPLVNHRISALYLSGWAKYLVSSTSPINADADAIPQVGYTSKPVKCPTFKSVSYTFLFCAGLSTSIRILSRATEHFFWLPCPADSLVTVIMPHSSSFLTWLVSAPLVILSLEASSFIFISLFSRRILMISIRMSEPRALKISSPSSSDLI